MWTTPAPFISESPLATGSAPHVAVRTCHAPTDFPHQTHAPDPGYGLRLSTKDGGCEHYPQPFLGPILALSVSPGDGGTPRC